MRNGDVGRICFWVSFAELLGFWKWLVKFFELDELPVLLFGHSLMPSLHAHDQRVHIIHFGT
jgi:hypothetical protein